MYQSSLSLSFSLSQSPWFSNLISLRCFSTALRCGSCNAYQFIRAITAIVISSSITAVFHTASVIRTCCLPYSPCSSLQLYFQLALGLRVYFENLFHGRSKLSPIRLPYDDLTQLVPGHQDLQFFTVYYSTSLLY